MRNMLIPELLKEACELRVATPKSLNEAIANGLAAGDLRKHVRDFLSQAFTAAMMNSRDEVKVQAVWIELFPEDADRFPEAKRLLGISDEHEDTLGIGA